MQILALFFLSRKEQLEYNFEKAAKVLRDSNLPYA